MTVGTRTVKICELTSLLEIIPPTSARALACFPPHYPPYSALRGASKAEGEIGYDRIAGALANLGLTVSAQTVGNIFKRHGIPPAPERKTTTTLSARIQNVKARCSVANGLGLLKYENRAAA